LIFPPPALTLHPKHATPNPKAPMHLRYINKQGISREIELTGEPIAIGRSRDAFIPLLDDKVSRSHCGIRLSDDGQFYVKDLNSRNGTYLNGERIEDSAPLKIGDKIRVGSTTFVFEQEKTAEAAEAAAAAVQGEMGAGKGYSTILREIVEDAAPAPAPAPAPAEAPAPAPAEAPAPKPNAARPAIRLGHSKPAASADGAAPAPGGKKKIVLKLK